MTEDTKDLQMAGCQVHLIYQALADGYWKVQGTVHCGLGENRGEQSVETGPFMTREAAEQDALDRLGTILGTNVDRSSSRVKNYS
jgi:hypothetical protein